MELGQELLGTWVSSKVSASLSYHGTPTVVKRQTVASVGKDVEKSEPSCAAGGNGKIRQLLRNQSAVPQTVKHRVSYHMTQKFYSQVNPRGK